MTNSTTKLLSAYLSLSTLTLSIATAAEATTPAPAAKATVPVATKSPIEFSVTSSIGYDSNVYLVNNGVLANRESTVSTLGAKVAAKFDSGVALSYSATENRYWDETSQDNVKHVLGASWANKLDAFSWNAATEFAQVDGSSTSANYNVGGVAQKSAFATAAPRERDDQLQNKTDLMVRYDTSQGFVRGVGKLQYWDMQTKIAPANQNENYVDRSDINGGVDVGRAFTKGGPEYYLGYRNGYQFQDIDGQSNSLNASNHYDRYLAGVDGKILPSLKLAAQAGWDIHQYDARALNKKDTDEGIYTDISATWTATKADEIQFKTSQSAGVSSTGKNSIINTVYQFAWKHCFSPAWSTSLTGRYADANYSPVTRDDIDYTAIAAVTWNASKNLSATFSYSQDWGRENGDVSINALQADQREFARSFVSASVTWKL
jgi:Putative beta-barrel porin 2